MPLALFWRKGPRARRRFLNLNYGALTRPNDVSKVLSFLTTYRGLHVKVGDPIDVLGFAATRPNASVPELARVIRRSILTFLYRSERVVEGPVLQPYHRVQEIVVRSPAVSAAVAEYAAEHKVSDELARVKAERMFREIAANMSSTFLAILDIVVGAVIRRLFVSVEDAGLERVSEVRAARSGRARAHPPLVLRLPDRLRRSSTAATCCRRTSRRARTWRSGRSASCGGARARSSCASRSPTRSTRRCSAPTSPT